MTAIDQAVLREVTALLEARIGLRSERSFLPRLARALDEVRVARAIEWSAVRSTIERDSTMLDEVVDRVTVQESGFFRHPEQFTTLVDTLLPRISGPVDIWCAASANGQEPYSLAMVLRETGREGSVLATDLAPAAVARTAAGTYYERELRNVSPRRLQRHFEPAEAGHRAWRVRDDVRALVTPRRHNLLGPIPDEVRGCQIVFCRNVLIYFTTAHATSFLDRLASAMSPDAHLVVGASETIWQINDRFESVRLGSGYVYRPRRSRPAAPSRPSTTPVTVAVNETAARPSRTTVVRPVRVAAAPATPAAPATSADASTVARLAGQTRLDAGDAAGAIVEFRRWTYDAPDDAIAHFHLGTALAASGDLLAARRAFRSALAALDRHAGDTATQTVEGYEVGELRRLLVARCANPGRAGDRSFEHVAGRAADEMIKGTRR